MASLNNNVPLPLATFDQISAELRGRYQNVVLLAANVDNAGISISHSFFGNDFATIGLLQWALDSQKMDLDDFLNSKIIKINLKDLDGLSEGLSEGQDNSNGADESENDDFNDGEQDEID